ncbi:PsiF family protein [Dyella psychrodurans]|uniref:PsiF repeat-containing protein n=1 Tax=Dyella psychrodurans TaxID=1927960 RepID=A0A370XAP3_9GAMM|nr:PsiF family protein [Dyella psychrodurans]RDS85458.1 hypothetical protein DWU99_08070 [Dyella psychrodurans]
MSTRISLLVASAVLALATTAAFAAPQSTPSSTTGHSTKLGQCSHANAGKTGADYKSAVAACMKGDTGAAAPAASDAKKTQQQKMADCSHANAGKKGADYKAAMSSCLKGS